MASSPPASRSATHGASPRAGAARPGGGRRAPAGPPRRPRPPRRRVALSGTTSPRRRNPSAVMRCVASKSAQPAGDRGRRVAGEDRREHRPSRPRASTAMTVSRSIGRKMPTRVPGPTPAAAQRRGRRSTSARSSAAVRLRTAPSSPSQVSASPRGRGPHGTRPRRRVVERAAGPPARPGPPRVTSRVARGRAATPGPDRPPHAPEPRRVATRAPGGDRGRPPRPHAGTARAGSPRAGRRRVPRRVAVKTRERARAGGGHGRRVSHRRGMDIGRLVCHSHGRPVQPGSSAPMQPRP